MNNNEIIDKWKTTGLLENLDENKKIERAKKLEECYFLSLKNAKQIKEDKTVNSEEFFGCIFPLIRKLFDEKDFKLPATKLIFKDFLKFFKMNYNVFKNLEKIHNIDGIAELMEMYLLKLNSNHKYNNLNKLKLFNVVN